MKNISIIGSTGSIGVSALEIIDFHHDKFRACALAAGKNCRLLIAQAKKFRPSLAAIRDETLYAELREGLSGTSVKAAAGESGIAEAASLEDADMVLSSAVGAAGLMPTVTAIKSGKEIALANKETLVMAGEYVNRLTEAHNIKLIPVDSEHSAIFQCLNNEPLRAVKKLILTASGGPFRQKPSSEFSRITSEEALRHPTWNMGRKISIDSATMMNKGLEVIECCHLFGVGRERIEVVIHPQSVVHSMVEYIDGSIIAHLGKTDMKIPIQYAFSHPERIESQLGDFDIFKASPLEFIRPDANKFPCLRLAYKALDAGGTAPAVMNGANEVAVSAFLDGKILFTDISETIDAVLGSSAASDSIELDDVLAADAESRIRAEEFINRISGKRN